MFKIISLAAIKSVSALTMQNNLNMAGMPASRPNMMPNYNNTSNQRIYNPGPRDECADKAMRENRIIEGVSIVPSDPITSQIENIERKQKCVATKIKAQQEFTSKVNKLIQQTAEDTKKDVSEASEKKQCVSKLDKANHECFVKNVLKDFYTSVVWKVAVHDNVAQLWYHDKLVLMIVYETVEYNIHPEEKECFTFFPTSNVAAEENALGHVVNIVGKPATPYNKTSSECRPCTDFLKDGKTLDGTGIKCSNNCDPANLLFTASNFKSKKTSNGSKTSSGSKHADASKGKEE